MTRNDDPTTRRDREPTDRPMADVSHTHPYADEGALDRLFERGPVVAADGGQRDAYDPDDESYDPDDEGTADADVREDDEQAREDADEREASGDERDETPMKDVDHTPPHGDGVDRVFERGGEHRRVESEE